MEKYNKLEVLEKTNIKQNSNKLWLCRCDCGTIKHVRSDRVRKGEIKSCGCLKHTHTKKKQESHVWKGYKDISGTYWQRIQYCAKRRNIVFDLTIEFIWDLYEKQHRKCALTGIDLEFAGDVKGKLYTASLDRIDSSKGYIENNVQWVHRKINQMKWEFTEEEFIKLCQSVVNWKCNGGEFGRRKYAIPNA